MKNKTNFIRYNVKEDCIIETDSKLALKEIKYSLKICQSATGSPRKKQQNELFDFAAAGGEK